MDDDALHRARLDALRLVVMPHAFSAKARINIENLLALGNSLIRAF